MDIVVRAEAEKLGKLPSPKTAKTPSPKVRRRSAFHSTQAKLCSPWATVWILPYATPPSKPHSIMRGIVRSTRAIKRSAAQVAKSNAVLFNGARTLATKAAAPALTQASVRANLAPKAAAREFPTQMVLFEHLSPWWSSGDTAARVGTVRGGFGGAVGLK